MRPSVTVDIDASAERVWAVMSEAESWPQWMPSDGFSRCCTN